MSIRGFFDTFRRVLAIDRGHRRVCVVDAMFPLFLYLVYSSENEVRDTLFIIGKTIPRPMAEKLGRFFYATDFEPQEGCEPVDDSRRRSSRMKLLLVNLLLLRRRKIFAQDHLTFSAKVLCRSRYTHLEDAPGSYRACLDRIRPITDPEALREDRRYNGYIHGRVMGTNPYCINRLVTRREDMSIPSVAGSRHEYVDLPACWSALPASQKRFVLDVFEVSERLLSEMKRKNTVIFTQPISLDCGIDEDEMKAIFGPVIERYGERNVVIKVHPRDGFDYGKAFPGVETVRSVAPMQLLNLVGCSFRRAVTICSTAVFHLPPETEVVWLGTRINAKLLKRYGDH